jgi:hypothetical protein
MYNKNNPTLEYVLFLGMGGIPPVSIIKALDLGIAQVPSTSHRYSFGHQATQIGQPESAETYTDDQLTYRAASLELGRFKRHFRIGSVEANQSQRILAAHE